MAHPNEEVVRQAFAAYERGDIETLRSQFLAPDIRWHFMRRSPLAGHSAAVLRRRSWAQ